MDEATHERIRAFVAAVPPGAVATYGDIAELAEVSTPRLVGRVLREDGVDLPWHRILRATGTPAPHLRQQQLELLRAEGVIAVGSSVSLRRYRWNPHLSNTGDMNSAPRTPDTDDLVTTPPCGLLLDVDGPIASPVTRTVAVPSIAEDLAAMANAGIPVIFNTGRSDAFIADQVVPPLRAAGLREGAPVITLSEKGAVWASVSADGLGEVQVDQELKLPDDFRQAIRDLVSETFSELMFFDETKRSMISAEQVIGTDHSSYLAAQKEFDAAAAELISRFELENVRIDPTIISTDIEHERVGKDLGAARALELLADRGITAGSWYTMGDSRTDYAMADWLHERGLEVQHVDVRPADGVPETPYPVLTSLTGAIHDDAGAEFLSVWRAAHL